MASPSEDLPNSAPAFTGTGRTDAEGPLFSWHGSGPKGLSGSRREGKPLRGWRVHLHQFLWEADLAHPSKVSLCKPFVRRFRF